MAHNRYTVLVGERGRFVLPAEVRRSLGVNPGDSLVLEVDAEAETVQLRRTADVARNARGLFRDLAPGTDLAADLMRDRREEAARDRHAVTPDES
jgi:AbrB family looped-hinge helix DNA binding protein